MRVSTLLLLQIVFRRLGRRAKSYFIIIIIIVDVDERRGGKKNRVKLWTFLFFTFLMRDNTHERGGREQKKGI